MDAFELKTNGQGQGAPSFLGLNTKALFPVTTNKGPENRSPK